MANLLGTNLSDAAVPLTDNGKTTHYARWGDHDKPVADVAARAALQTSPDGKLNTYNPYSSGQLGVGMTITYPDGTQERLRVDMDWWATATEAQKVAALQTTLTAYDPEHPEKCWWEAVAGSPVLVTAPDGTRYQVHTLAEARGITGAGGFDGIIQLRAGLSVSANLTFADVFINGGRFEVEILTGVVLTCAQVDFFESSGAGIIALERTAHASVFRRLLIPESALVYCTDCQINPSLIYGELEVGAGSFFVFVDGVAPVGTGTVRLLPGCRVTDADVLLLEDGGITVDDQRGSSSGGGDGTDTQARADIVDLQQDVSDLEQGKQDALGFTPINKAGDTVTGDLLSTGPRIDNDSRLATIGELRDLVNGLSFKDEARVLLTAIPGGGTLATAGLPIVQGVQLLEGDRVILALASAASGLYVAKAAGWTRTTDADTKAEIMRATLFVSEGDYAVDGNGNPRRWTATLAASGTLGSSVFTFVESTGASSYAAGAGLAQTGTTFSVDPSTIPQTSSYRLVSDAQIAGWNAKINPPVVSTGTVLYFDKDRNYGTDASPQTAVAYTADTTTAVEDTLTKLVHMGPAKPTLPGTQAPSSESYKNNEINRIFFWWTGSALKYYIR
ncbi:hypothetical protein [Hymenobacter guriensis]|uniref:Uncharacterized protein n=1 Tax=Hymenobacter guriensis TaxID=2793065 RepID=A0ABS0KWZ8_9BACT|nr:hypothetical protein [Hymenobacter guriensis]MBG8552363.1 hypothetical protein [Hymenobacter guriensis]